MGTFFKIIGIAIAFALLGTLLAFAFVWVAGLLAIIFAIFAIAGLAFGAQRSCQRVQGRPAASSPARRP